MERDDFDVIVVGAGATGGFAADTLSAAGMHVLVLDAGPRSDADSPPEEAPRFEASAADRSASVAERQAVQRQCIAFNETTRGLFVDDLDHPYTTAADKSFAWIRVRRVGGRLLLWPGHVPRMEERDFRAASHDGFGVDWPFGYDELRPYYDAVERLLGVTDARTGGVPLTEGASRLQSSIARTYQERRVQAARVARSPETGAPRAPLDAIERALATGRTTLASESIASRVLLDSRGRAAGVVVIDARTGREREVKGRAVVLCASTIESIRILLNSATPKHPNGLGTPGVLGHYLMDHTAGIRMDGFVPGTKGYAEERSLVGGGIYIPRFRNIDDHHPAFLRGYGIQGVIGPVVTAAELRTRPGDFETNLARLLTDMPPSGFSMMAFGEVLAREENAVALDPSVRDAWGIPVPQIRFEYTDNEFAMGQDMAAEMRAMVTAAGFEVKSQNTELYPPGLSIHELGGARMGVDPKSSVLGPFNEVWDVPNLFVTDGACFPSGGCQNPTLTMLAITVRACESLANRWKMHAL
ncbi:MAG TPA: GMC family oxidoreductase [Labilithrix sp.]|nr:GMC family oxidoreductase [Labilithrix sp.]